MPTILRNQQVFINYLSLYYWVIQGARVGTAIVKEAAEIHQGKIKVVSQLGKGTVVAVIFPAA